MAKALCLGQMVLNTKVNGLWGEHMAEAHSSILKVKFMKENGNMIKPQALESILILMEQNMKVSGFQIYSMGKGQRNGPMVQYFKESMEKVRKTGKENINGLMVHNMRVNGKIMRLVVMAIISGQMAVSIWVTGRVT